MPLICALIWGHICAHMGAHLAWALSGRVLGARAQSAARLETASRGVEGCHVQGREISGGAPAAPGAVWPTHAGACHVRLRLLTSHYYPFLACVHEQLGTHKRAKAKRELCQNLLRAAARKK